LLVTGCWLLVTGYWLLGAGCWLLVTGCWVLVTGCWLLVGDLGPGFATLRRGKPVFDPINDIGTTPSQAEGLWAIKKPLCEGHNGSFLTYLLISNPFYLRGLCASRIIILPRTRLRPEPAANQKRFTARSGTGYAVARLKCYRSWGLTVLRRLALHLSAAASSMQ